MKPKPLNAVRLDREDDLAARLLSLVVVGRARVEEMRMSMDRADSSVTYDVRIATLHYVQSHEDADGFAVAERMMLFWAAEAERLSTPTT